MRSVWPFSVSSFLPLGTSQTWMMRSSEAVANRPPSRLKASALMGRSCPSRVHNSSWEWMFQRRTTPSSWPVAICARLGAKATIVTQDGWGKPYDLGDSSYGDDPRDQAQIKAGYEYYNSGMWRVWSD